MKINDKTKQYVKDLLASQVPTDEDRKNIASAVEADDIERLDNILDEMLAR